VLLYDMALLGLLVADQGKTIGAAAFNWLLLFDPADVYRLLNLAGLSKASHMPMARPAAVARSRTMTLTR